MTELLGTVLQDSGVAIEEVFAYAGHFFGFPAMEIRKKSLRCTILATDKSHPLLVVGSVLGHPARDKEKTVKLEMAI